MLILETLSVCEPPYEAQRAPALACWVGRGDFGLSDAEMSYVASLVGLAAVLACGISCLSERVDLAG